MGVFDTFYLLFKGNQDEAVKANKRVEKSSKEVREEITKTKKEADDLGKNFVKVAENATAAFTAMFSLGAIKSGILDTAKLNSNLEVQGKILGQNVTDIKAYGAAVKAAGGSVEGFQGALQTAFSAAANAGLPLPPVDVLMRRYHEAVKGLSKNEAARRLGMLGVSDPGMISLLTQNDEDFEKSIAAGREHAAVTERDTAAAREWEKALSQAHDSLQSLFTTIGTDILPAMTSMVETFTEFTDGLKNDKVAMYEFFGGMVVVATAAAKVVGKLVGSLIAGGAATSPGGWLYGLSKGANVAGAVAVGLPLIAEGSFALGQAGGRLANRLLGRGDKDGVLSAPVASPAKTGRAGVADAMAFYMANGYSRAQAAGIVANEQRESSGNPRAVGDNGRAIGLYQWHPDRRHKILSELGIDITSASPDEQRRAAIWEMQQMGLDSKIKGMDDPNAVAALFSRRFERPANGDFEAITRGKMAIDIANGSPFSSASNTNTSKTVSVSIDQVNVSTQATDAGGIARDMSNELNAQLRTTVANFDDGVAR